MDVERQEFEIRTGAEQLKLVISGDGQRFGLQRDSEGIESTLAEAGAALSRLLSDALPDGAASINGLDVHRVDGRRLGTLRPVLEGARVVWTAWYRADRDASVFRSLGSRGRMQDAFQNLVAALSQDVAQPHKP